MSSRTLIATAAVAATLIAVPTSASARPADAASAGPTGPVQYPRYAAPSARGAAPIGLPHAAAASRSVGSSDDTSTMVVLVIALSALIVGAATGFEGGRVVTRHRVIGH